MTHSLDYGLMKSLVISALLVLIFPSISYSKNNVWKVFFTNSMPPYLSEDRKSGLELDIVRAAMEAVDAHFHLDDNINYQRGIIELGKKKIDAMVGNSNNEKYAEKLQGKVYFSNSTISYIDCVISLKERRFKLNSFKDYKDKSIWAFQSAKHVLGEEFKSMADKNPQYSEEHDQKKQAKLLINHRLDLAISDKNIFLYQLHKLNDKKYGADKFQFKSISKPTPRSVIFVDKAKRDLFNKGLKRIKANGVYQKILKKYKKMASQSC